MTQAQRPSEPPVTDAIKRALTNIGEAKAAQYDAEAAGYRAKAALAAAQAARIRATLKGDDA